MMTLVRLRAALLVALLIAAGAAPAMATATPKPKTPAKKRVVIPAPHLPNVKLHTEFVVEVNQHGQVVRVKSGKSCKNLTFNAQTYGNVLQMWIRHPDGSAQVGLYRVVYDYDPANKIVHRHISLVARGGNWGNDEGAANQMLDIAKREAAAAAAKSHDLPSLNEITGKKTPAPKATATPAPIIPN